ncbi:MAG: GNAT family N-acetyltransferase [Methanomicrobiaceae archaeon]|nr:GNAT family N-acetyltransferase [Methanomicrobiaceae archaeon]
MKSSKYNVTVATEAESAAWDAVVSASPHASPFHLWQWLQVEAAWSGARFYPLIVSTGTTIIALCPVFITRRWLVPCGFSPAPRSPILYLGPVIAEYETLKQEKRESRYIEVQKAVDHFLFTLMHCRFVRLLSAPGLDDARPYRWAGYDTDPLYTYRLDLTVGEAAVWERFVRQARVTVKRAVREGVTVSEGGRDEYLHIIRSVRKRLAEQGRVHVPPEGYFEDLYAVFGSGLLRVFSADYKGECVGGMICLHHNGILYQWVGVPKPDLRGVSPNDLVNWEAIRWACHNGCTAYEIMDGGDNPRLRHFKSKYNPDLHIWFSAVRYSSPVYRVMKTIRDCLI